MLNHDVLMDRLAKRINDKAVGFLKNCLYKKSDLAS